VAKSRAFIFAPTPAFANPEVYEFLEAEGIKYAIRLPANRVLQERIGYLLNRPVGRPSNDVRRSYASFTYQAGSWSRPREMLRNNPPDVVFSAFSQAFFKGAIRNKVRKARPGHSAHLLVQ
jgi:hypothetical protein